MGLPACAFALIVFFEWRTDEETITLAVIVSSAGACGFVQPRLFWVMGIVLGLAVAGVDTTMALTGWLPRYEAKPPTLGASISLVVLAVPSLIGAAIGAGIGKLAQSLRVKPRLAGRVAPPTLRA